MSWLSVMSRILTDAFIILVHRDVLCHETNLIPCVILAGCDLHSKTFVNIDIHCSLPLVAVRWVISNLLDHVLLSKLLVILDFLPELINACLSQLIDSIGFLVVQVSELKVVVWSCLLLTHGWLQVEE